MKKCRICKEIKTFDLFHKDKSRKDGYRQCCKKCDSADVLKRIRKNRVALNDTHWKLLARKHNTQWKELKEKYLQQKQKCFYCKHQLSDGNLHIEHFNPRQKKLVISCADCNRLKWERTGKEFISFVKEYASRFF